MSARVTAQVTLLALLGIAFPTLFALAVVVAVIAVAVVVGHVAFVFLKVLWVLVFPLFAALRGLWHQPVQLWGEALTAEDAPELFEVEARLRAAAKATRIDGIYLTGDLNASMSQFTRFGIFGGTRNVLHIGLPLMLALDEAHFTATLAHEIGHLARRHGGFVARIYSMRNTLDQMVVGLFENRSPLVYPVAMFYRAFVPRFDRATLSLSRSVELEADDAAAQAVGASVTGEALTVTYAIDALYAEAVWPRIWRRAADEPDPPADVYTLVADELRRPVAGGRRLLATALEARTAESDTHPALIDRLHHIGVDPDALAAAMEHYAVPGRSAADAFLSRAAAQRRALAHEWRVTARLRWAEEHAAALKLRARLAQLDALGADAQPAERRERALAACALHRADGRALVLDGSDAMPADAALALRGGLMLADDDDERAIVYLERAMAADVTTTALAAPVARDFFVRRHDAARAAAYDARIVAWQALASDARAERQRFTGAEPVEPHGLSDEELAPVRSALDLPDIAAAYLARRRIAHVAEKPQFVLAVARNKGKYGTSVDNIAAIISGDLASFEHDVLVVVSSKRRNAIVEALRVVDGTLLRL